MTTAVVNPSPDCSQRKTAKTVVFSHSPPVSTLDELELSNSEMEGTQGDKGGQKQQHGALPNRAEIFPNLHYLSFRAR
jgi:hypothetical protein